jgi:hypothetical protein
MGVDAMVHGGDTNEKYSSAVTCHKSMARLAFVSGVDDGKSECFRKHSA